MHLQRLLLLSVPLLPAVLAVDSPIDGYGVMIPEWEVEVTSGSTMVLAGTIEKVHEKLLQMNPNWNEEYNSTQNSAGNGKRDSNIHLFSRNVFSGAEYKCGGTLPECHPTGIATGIDYLRSVKGKPKNGPGPGNCGRVSCTQNGAIWWCNDNASSKTLDGFGDIADGAEYLGKKCTRWGWENGSYKAFLSGKAFHEDNWNVIVQKDSC
ncbi:hypothetical protein FPOA_03500 [Fusarium poae]|uniref:Ecp2 effector protein domain-containing protein n=1 Tax=Fusarium poae TaxID=36050 RepID=A0A1B8BA25_FUSPO|nr:hypothetical protein FPOA_03500 [Fusarium poae]